MCACSETLTFHQLFIESLYNVKLGKYSDLDFLTLIVGYIMEKVCIHVFCHFYSLDSILFCRALWIILPSQPPWRTIPYQFEKIWEFIWFYFAFFVCSFLFFYNTDKLCILILFVLFFSWAKKRNPHKSKKTQFREMLTIFFFLDNFKIFLEYRQAKFH